MVQYCDLHECEIDRRGCPWCLIESLEQQLQQAHKDGWEQCKREAGFLAFYWKDVIRIQDAIANMDYKEV